MKLTKSTLSALLLVLAGMVTTSAAAPNPATEAWIAQHLNPLLDTYRQIHANPELSLYEEKTAELAATALRNAGYQVQTGIGGYGVVGILSNGDGPTVLIRGDMDALPVTETTGLPYASTARAVTPEGLEIGVMHACGHDMHVTNLIGSATLLADLRDQWRGTLVILAQPAEELGKGALNMLNDGLLQRIPMPDYARALHGSPEVPAGTSGYVSGGTAANVDTVKITIHGRGGHGARPNEANDPIVTAAQLVTALQTLVSRRLSPIDAAVVTVGSFHGGSKANIIPERVDLALTVRSYTNEARRTVLDGIRQLTDGICQAFACPKPADIWINPDATPAVYNDPALTARAVAVLQQDLGAGQVTEIKATLTGEDFGRYTIAGGFPSLLIRVGTVNLDVWRQAKATNTPLPGLHSSLYAPDPKPTLLTSLRATAAIALDLLAPSPMAEPASQPANP
jgi:hippurate hydrolase